MGTRIVNFAADPRAIGGTETFSRILNTHFVSRTYSFRRAPQERRVFDAEVTVLGKTGSDEPEEKYLLPDAVHDIVIFNAPVELDWIPEEYLKNNTVIYVAHNCPDHVSRHPRYLGSNKDERLKKFAHVNKVVCLSEDYVGELSVLLNLPPSRISAAEHTVEVAPRERHKTFQPTVITICRLVPEKRLDLFIRAAREHPELRFLIYGDGRLRESLEQEVASDETLSNVSVCGPTNDLVEAHASAGIFLMTSDFEGVGITLIESLSQGTPAIIAQDSFAQARHIIQDGVNGYVCAKYDQSELSERINLVSSNYEEFSASSIRSFARYSPSRFVERWTSIFDEVLGRPSGLLRRQ